MPNHCYNRVDIGINSDSEDAKQQFSKILEIFESSDPFNRIIPEPNWGLLQDPKRGEFSKVKEMTAPNGTVICSTRQWEDGTQDDRWYSWRLENWDTLSGKHTTKKLLTLTKTLFKLLSTLHGVHPKEFMLG